MCHIVKKRPIFTSVDVGPILTTWNRWNLLVTPFSLTSWDVTNLGNRPWNMRNWHQGKRVGHFKRSYYNGMATMAPGWWFPLEAAMPDMDGKNSLRERNFSDTRNSAHVSETPEILNFHQCPHTTVLQFDAFPDQLTTKQRVAIFCTTDLSTIKRKKRSNLEVMALSEDFSLPPDLQIHSVVLRIASTGLCMCLHYDVCDNFRCCIRGCKRVVLLSLSSSWHWSASIGQPVADLISIAQSCLLATTEALPHWLDKASINVNMFVLHPETMANCTIQKTFGQTGGASSCTRGCFSVFQKKVIASRTKTSS